MMFNNIAILDFRQCIRNVTSQAIEDMAMV